MWPCMGNEDLHVVFKDLSSELLYFRLEHPPLPQVETKLTGRLRELFMPLMQIQRLVHNDEPDILEKYAPELKQK